MEMYCFINSVGTLIHFENTLCMIGQSNKNGCLYYYHFCCFITVRLIFLFSYIFNIFITLVFYRSILSNDISRQFMATRYAWCNTTSNIFMCITIILVMHLSWFTTKWKKIFNILFTKINCYNANMVMCYCIGNMGKM